MKKRFGINALAAILASVFVLAGCEMPPDPEKEAPAFIAVTDITGVPAATAAGTDLPLTGAVEPSDATNKDIVWTIAAANTLNGATVVNGVLKTTTAGAAKVTATITNGASATADYTQTFDITVNAAITPPDPDTFNDISAAELVAGIKIGWNLGNTLDAYRSDGWSGAYPTDVAGMETSWSNPNTTKTMITAIKTAGFNGIRIPVTWHKAAGAAPDYTIRPDWMARVKEVVDYAVDNDMYILLNTHHDEAIFKFTSAEKTASIAAFKKIWAQIADTFKDYNEKLVFEGLNEPRTIGSGQEWNGGTQAEREVLNEHHQAFVDTVRASGGNNGKRILMVSTYAASATQDAVNGLTLPTDTANNKIIVSIHAYSPYSFAHDSSGQNTWSKNNAVDVSGVTGAINPAYNKFAANGTPVIIGEFGALDTKNAASRAEWATYYVSYAKSKGIPCFWWDGGSDAFSIFTRNTSAWKYPLIKDALMNGIDAEVDPGDGGEPTPPTNIAGNMGNYIFGKQEDNVTPNYQVAIWTLSSANVTLAKAAGTKLVLQLTNAPTATMVLVWQGGGNYWEETTILNNGSPANGSVQWNSGAKTLTITLNADTIKNYATTFASQTSLTLVIGYWSGGSVNDLGITSANLLSP